jgi:hypothetical protein
MNARAVRLVESLFLFLDGFFEDVREFAWTQYDAVSLIKTTVEMPMSNVDGNSIPNRMERRKRDKSKHRKIGPYSQSEWREIGCYAKEILVSLPHHKELLPLYFVPTSPPHSTAWLIVGAAIAAETIRPTAKMPCRFWTFDMRMTSSQICRSKLHYIIEIVHDKQLRDRMGGKLGRGLREPDRWEEKPTMPKTP